MRKPPQSNMKLSLDHVMLFHKILANETENHLTIYIFCLCYVKIFSSLFLVTERNNQQSITFLSFNKIIKKYLVIIYNYKNPMFKVYNWPECHS